MSSIFNIAKSQGANKDGEEQTLLAMWTARADIGVKCLCAAFSPESDYLAVGTTDGAVSIFNPKDGRILSKLGASYTNDPLADNGRGITMSVKFNPVSASKPKLRVALSSGAIECFDVKTKSSNATNVIEGHQILAMDYSPDGKYYAGGGMDPQTPDKRGHAAQLYDDQTSKLVRLLEGDATAPGHSNRLSCIRFKSKNELATGSLDGTVKLWSTGCKDPYASFPQHGSADAAGSFEVAGSSIDFEGDYMLVGSARPHKHLLIFDLRMNKLVSEVAWRKLKPAKSAAARKWNLAKLAHLQKTNILAASFADGGKLIAGGSGANTVKVFQPVQMTSPPGMRLDAYPVAEAREGEGELQELYTPVASFETPSAVMGIHVSPKPVLKAGDRVGKGADVATCTEDMKMIAVAASNGNVYGVRMPKASVKAEPQL